MSSKKSIGLGLIILGFILIALTGIRTISNPEIFTHIALGQAGSSAGDPISYTMDNQEWINLHPLYNKIAAALWATGGAAPLTIAHVAVVLAAFILILRLSKNWGGPVSQGIALLICAWLLQPVFTPGPAAFAMLFIALFVTLLQRTKNMVVLATSLLILQVLWTNIHPSFIFGPILILFFAFENKQATRAASRVSMTTPLTSKLMALAGAALLVTLANPNFFKLHIHILSNWFLLVRADSPEWISLFSSGFAYDFTEKLYFFTLILCAGGLITLQKKLPPTVTMLAVTGALIGIISYIRSDHSIRALLAYTLLALPFMVLSLNSVSTYLSQSLTAVISISEKALQITMGVIALALMLFTAGAIVSNNVYVNMGSASSFGLGVEKEAFPVAAAELLSRDDFPEKIVNLSYDGGYLALQNPSRKVFCDTRQTFYGMDFYSDLNRALLGYEEWKTLMTDWNPHAVVINGAWRHSGALANRLAGQFNRRTREPIWKLVYFDGSTIVLVRNLPEYKTLINDPTIQKNGLTVLEATRKQYVDGNRGHIKTGNSPRLIGAAGIFLALNRPAEAEAIYSSLTLNSPSMATAWLGLGQSYIYQKKLTEGIQYMEDASQILPQNFSIWKALHNAYLMKGDEEKAAVAADKLNRFYEAEKATIEQQKDTVADRKQTETTQTLPQRDGEPAMPEELR